MLQPDRTVVETIETLTERLQTSTLLDDRRDACRGLRSLAKDYRELCAQSMEALLQAIKIDRHDTEMVKYCLDALNYIISGADGDKLPAEWHWPESDAADQVQTNNSAGASGVGRTANKSQPEAARVDHGRELAEIFLKKSDNVTTILDTIIDDDSETTCIAVRILCGLARENLAMVQDSILSFPLNMSRLIQLVTVKQGPISFRNECIRNDALVLFVRLTKFNQNIQNLVAYENFFDKIMDIIRQEGYLDGTVAVVMDCLNILMNLTQYNESNQVLFREGSHIQKLMPFFNNTTTIQWTGERTDCLVAVLRIIDSMIVPTNTPDHVEACQMIMVRCGLLDKLCELLTATSMPIGVLSETMNTASDIVRGQLGPNAHMVMQTNAMMPVLLLSLVKDMCQYQEKRLIDLHKYIVDLHNYLSTSK